MGGAVLVLCGLPAAGKSALAHEICDIMRNMHSFSLVLHVEFDRIEEIVAKSSGRVPDIEDLVQQLEQSAPTPHNNEAAFNPCLWQIARQASERVVHHTLTTNREARPLVVVDDNMHYRSMRLPLYRLAQTVGAGFAIVHVTCSLATCLERNCLRKRSVPDHVIRAMATTLEPPDPSLHPWEANTLTLVTEPPLQQSLSAEWYDALIHLLSHQLPPPPSLAAEHALTQAGADRVILSQSTAHHLDLALRRLVATTMGTYSRDTPREVKVAAAKSLNSKRRDMLNKVRTGELTGTVDELQCYFLQLVG